MTINPEIDPKIMREWDLDAKYIMDEGGLFWMTRFASITKSFKTEWVKDEDFSKCVAESIKRLPK